MAFLIPFQISLTNSGLVIAGSPNLSIKVVNYAIVTSTQITITFQDSLNNNLSGPLPCAPQGGVSFPGMIDSPAFILAPGLGLYIALSSAVSTGGHGMYCLV